MPESLLERQLRVFCKGELQPDFGRVHPGLGSPEPRMITKNYHFAEMLAG